MLPHWGKIVRNDKCGVIMAEKLAETGRGRELVRVYLGYRVAVGGGSNTWPAVVQVGPNEPGKNQGGVHDTVGSNLMGTLLVMLKGISLSAEEGGELSGEVSSSTMVAELWVGFREKLGTISIGSEKLGRVFTGL
ncbi:hypothetical protein Tco_0927231 [Tanacetum coccineum]